MRDYNQLEEAYNKVEKAIQELARVYYENDFIKGAEALKQDETAPSNIIGIFAECTFKEYVEEQGTYQELKKMIEIIYNSETEEEAVKRLKEEGL